MSSKSQKSESEYIGELYKKTLDTDLSFAVIMSITNNYAANFATAAANTYKISIIDFSAQDLANVLSPFLNQGSKPSYLTRDDLTVYKIKYRSNSSVPTSDRIDENSDFSTLMSIGNNKFFDVLFWLSLDPADRPPMTEIQEGSNDQPTQSGDICRALFVQYFFILTRGRVSNAATATVGTDMPKFLKVVLNCSESPLHYMEVVASFDMHKIGYEWVRYVPFGSMAREAVSRFGLGVAGYRMFSPFRMLQPRAGLPTNIMRAIDIARQMATASASWDLHPATRDNAILQTYGPLNANLGNLMLEAYDHGDLATLVTTKALFQIPTEDPMARQYRNWTVEYVPNVAANIF